MLALALAGVSFSVILICFILVTYARWHYGSLEKLGIPVVKPHFILGSFPDYYKRPTHEVDYALFKQYGDVFGVRQCIFQPPQVYEGRTPKIYVCDPEIVRQIFVKQVDKFPIRGYAEHFAEMGVIGREFMEYTGGEKWKMIRSSLTPLFTSSRLKKMSRQMIEAVRDYVELMRSEIQRKTEKGFLENHDLYQETWLMFFDMVARCTLNIKIQDPRNPNNPFAVAATAVSSNHEFSPFLAKFRFAFPFLYKLRPAKSYQENSGFFERMLKDAIAQRTETREKNEDFVDMLVALIERVNTKEFERLKITEQTVLANAIQFYLGGRDNMAIALTTLAFYLTKNSQIEAKVYEEVDAYFERHHGKVTYETLNELVYLNACLQEAMRLHPIFTRIDRKCAEDVEINGLKIKKGMAVVVPLWPYNRNPKYFVDPETFNPERFMPNNKDKLNPMALATFGWGPRMCVAMRFSFEGLLVSALHLFRSFTFTSNPDTEITHIAGYDALGIMGPLPLNIHLR